MMTLISRQRLDTLCLLAAHERALGCGATQSDLMRETGIQYGTWAARVQTLMRGGLVAGWRLPGRANVHTYRLTSDGWSCLESHGVELCRSAA